MQAATLALGAGLATTVLAQGYRPAFRPEQLKGPPVGAPNQVLVLGSPHLSALPDAFQLPMLEPLLQRLQGWKPDAIAIERVSGLQCDSLRRYPSRYASAIEDYCVDTQAAASTTGLDVPAANAEAERLLAQWPAQPSAAQRRHLAAVFLAAGEPASALVQWLRLPLHERTAGEGLDDALVATLRGREARRNETEQVAAVLAARLGLERLWSVDDHSADSDYPDPEAWRVAVTRAWDNPYARARRARDKQLMEGLAQADGVVALYRAYNDPAWPMLAYQADFGAALVEPSAQSIGRLYVGYWETRNLRMVANIRDVLAHRPGTRLLALVGASHKGYYDAYLNLMHDVQLVDAQAVLR